MAWILGIKPRSRLHVEVPSTHSDRLPAPHQVLNATAPVVRSNYLQGSGELNDPYEGETMTVLLDLFGDFSGEHSTAWRAGGG